MVHNSNMIDIVSPSQPPFSALFLFHSHIIGLPSTHTAAATRPLAPTLPPVPSPHHLKPTTTIRKRVCERGPLKTPITKPHHQVPILLPEPNIPLASIPNPDRKFETKYPLPNPIIIINKEEEALEVES